MIVARPLTRSMTDPSWAISPTPAPILAEDTAPKPTQVKAPAVSDKARPAPVEIRAKVSALQSLNVRQSPTRRSAGLGVLYSGDEVILTGRCRAGWAEIQYTAGPAWVDARYLSGDHCKEEE